MEYKGPIKSDDFCGPGFDIEYVELIPLSDAYPALERMWKDHEYEGIIDLIRKMKAGYDDNPIVMNSEFISYDINTIIIEFLAQKTCFELRIITIMLIRKLFSEKLSNEVSVYLLDTNICEYLFNGFENVEPDEKCLLLHVARLVVAHFPAYKDQVLSYFPIDQIFNSMSASEALCQSYCNLINVITMNTESNEAASCFMELILEKADKCDDKSKSQLFWSISNILNRQNIIAIILRYDSVMISMFNSNINTNDEDVLSAMASCVIRLSGLSDKVKSLLPDLINLVKSGSGFQLENGITMIDSIIINNPQSVNILLANDFFNILMNIIQSSNLDLKITAMSCLCVVIEKSNVESIIENVLESNFIEVFVDIFETCVDYQVLSYFVEYLGDLFHKAEIYGFEYQMLTQFIEVGGAVLFESFNEIEDLSDEKSDFINQINSFLAKWVDNEYEYE